MRPALSREVHLKSRPEYLPSLENFEIVETLIPALDEGQVLVQNLFFSVDPYMRGRMVERTGANSFQLGKPMEGACVGVVLQSRSASIKAGDYALGEKSWREYYISAETEVTKIELDGNPIQTHLGVLGMSGFTAYLGLHTIGQLREGETVFVSAAAGSVGNVVCQLAKLKGCKVIGSAGSDEKVRWLQELGGIDAFNYRKVESIRDALHQLCPAGIDLYFDNVGGPHLEAALECMRTHGRIVLCGMMSKMEQGNRPFALSNLNLAVRQRLTLTGFRASDHLDLYPKFFSDVSSWIKEGKIASAETIVNGLENAPAAFLGLFKGENLGKMLVRV
jgi:NADPH-dependent curcumin reductase CurA